MQPWNFSHNKREKILIIVLGMMMVFFLFFLIDNARAQNQDTFGIQPVGQSISLGSQDIRFVVGKIVRAVLGLLGAIAASIIIYAGYLIMTSGGNEEKVTKGKRTLINAVIGLAIILSALAIVQFFLNALSANQQKSTGPAGPGWDSFMGSGGLGRIVKEHYPLRNQKDVPRNTKISITFVDAIDPSSVIENTNQTCWPKDGTNKPVAIGQDMANCLKDKDGKPVEYFGDCVLGDNFSWEKSCDRLKIDAVGVYNSTSTDYKNLYPAKPEYFVQAAAMAVYEKVKEPGEEKGPGEYNVFTFVFKPLAYLGSESENMPYTARVTSKINKKPQNAEDEPVSVFDRQYTPYYYWEFETGTYLDLTPPHVEIVRPKDGSKVPKNNIVQVYFSEAMDPTVTQGYLSYDSISHLFFNTMVAGTWKLANGYKVAEFVSDLECGVNSCGEKMYCLPVACADPKDKNCAQDYEALARAGELFNKDGSTFESVPFSGIMDMAGNALDGNNNSAAENRPNSSVSFADQKKPDNYFWQFIVQNRVDRSPPVIEWITPAIDKEAVGGKDPLKIRFNRVMMLSTLYFPNIFLEEYPLASSATSGVKDVLGFYPDSILKTINDVDKTELQIKTTREFGPYFTDLYYFPEVYSKVKTETQNCLYPGRGPWGPKGSAPVCVHEEDENGNVLIDKNCVPVNMVSSTDTGCAQTSQSSEPLAGKVLQSDVSKCIKFMQKWSPSIYIK